MDGWRVQVIQGTKHNSLCLGSTEPRGWFTRSRYVAARPASVKKKKNRQVSARAIDRLNNSQPYDHSIRPSILGVPVPPNDQNGYSREHEEQLSSHSLAGERGPRFWCSLVRPSIWAGRYGRGLPLQVGRSVVMFPLLLWDLINPARAYQSLGPVFAPMLPRGHLRYLFPS